MSGVNATVQVDSGTQTYADSISSAGGITKTGSGNLSLTGTNDYSGGTTVSAGTLSGNTSSLQGNINNNAAVILNQSTNGTYAGNMSGGGSLTKSGTGTVTMTGSNSYTGPTQVNAGTLLIDGTSTSSSTHRRQRRHARRQRHDHRRRHQQRQRRPRRSDTMTVNGNYTQNSGGNMQIQINNAGHHARSE